MMIDWQAQPLGRVSDVELSERLGVDVSEVRIERQARGLSCANQTGADNRPKTVRARIVRFMVREIGATATAGVIGVERDALVSWLSGSGALSKEAFASAKAWSVGSRRLPYPDRTIDEFVDARREPMGMAGGFRVSSKRGQP